MPTTYKKADETVTNLAAELIAEFPTHESLTENRVRIDYVFAYGERDEVTGDVIGDALKHHGVKALGIAKKLSLKERGLGRGDAEICLDADWWVTAEHEERRALLDHELHHFAATSKRDEMGRPVLKMRKHDYDFGWFAVIAHRHGQHSQERKQAASMMEVSGQFFWPDFTKAHEGAKRFARLETANA